MNFHKLQAIDYLLKEVKCTYSTDDIVEYSLVFKMDKDLYTGDFTEYDEASSNFFVPVYTDSKPQKSLIYNSELPFIRTSFLESPGDVTKYNKKPDYFLQRLIDHVNLNDTFSEIPKVIFNLQKLGSDKKLDFYFVTNETFSPVSLIVK